MIDRSIAAEFVLRCFHARTAAHLLHLKTRSFAEHKALNDFYDAIVPVTDDFAEAYQGHEGLLAGYKAGFTLPTSALDLLQSTREWIEDNRCLIACGDDGDDDEDEGSCDASLAALVDNVVAVFDSAIYKLRFLS